MKNGGLLGAAFGLEYTLLRFASLAFVALIAVSFPWTSFQSFFIALLFAHYALSFYYAKNLVQGIAVNRKVWLPLALLAGISLVYFALGFHLAALIPFIGVHIALSDTYMINDLGMKPGRALWHLNVSRFSLNLSLYALVLHHYEVFSEIPRSALHLAVALSFIYFAIALSKIRSGLPETVVRDFFAFEVLGVTAAYALFFAAIKITPQHFVLYHVALWTIFPAIRFHEKGDRKSLNRFLALNASAAGICFWLAPRLAGVVPLWASLHFISSFVLSRHNPKVLTTAFYQRIRAQ